MIKTLKKLSIGEIYLNIIQAIYGKHTANIILRSESLKASLLRPGTRQGRPLSPFLFNTVLEVLVRVARHEKEVKGIQITKKEVKLSLSADDMTLKYRKTLKNSLYKLLKLINNCRGNSGQKKSTYKTPLHFYTLTMNYLKNK